MALAPVRFGPPTAMANLVQDALFALVCVTSVFMVQSAIVDVPHMVTVPSDTAHSGGVHSTAPLSANVTEFKGIGGSSARNGWLTVFDHAAPYFSVQAASKSCGLAWVSTQAAAHNCSYATNAGPFKSLVKGGCTGAVIVDKTVIASDFSVSNAMFALTAAGEWILGSVDNETHAVAMGVTQLVTGFNWLVYDKQATVSTAGGELAPRTAVGVDAQGRLMLLEVDGCEKCSTGKGMTMKQLADFMASPAVGAVHAVNLDGGGSSTFVRKDAATGKEVVVNWPTCVDINFKCERSVATIMCVA